MKIIASILALVCLAITGCMTYEKTVIQTPAVYALDPSTGKSNLISAATVTKSAKKDRLFLPAGYALSQTHSVWGIQVAATDRQTGTPKVQAGIIQETFHLTPTSSNTLFAPSITDRGEFSNKAMPFWMGGKQSYTSGNSQVTATDTNATAGAISPGTPTDQVK